jgi:hypothetical protein
VGTAVGLRKSPGLEELIATRTRYADFDDRLFADIRDVAAAVAKHTFFVVIGGHLTTTPGTSAGLNVANAFVTGGSPPSAISGRFATVTKGATM